MSAYPFGCLVVGSRDREVDAVVADLLGDAGHAVAHLPVSDLLATLQARRRPAVVVKNLNASRGGWRDTSPALASAPEVTRRFGYVVLNLYAEWTPDLLRQAPADHDVVILPLPQGMSQVVQTVEQVGLRTASRWAAS